MNARLVSRATPLALALALARIAARGPGRPQRPSEARVRCARSSCRLSSGFRFRTASSVVLVGMHEVPVVEVVLVVRAGATADPTGREGHGRHDGGAARRGGCAARTRSRSPTPIDFLGASIGAGASWDSSTVRLRVPVARLEPALALLADVALRPDFPAAELERLRKEALTDLLQARDVPGAIAARALAQAVFGPAHRYGKPMAGDAAQLASFTVAELRAFHATRYTPLASTIVVVGDVTAAVLPALEKAFGSVEGHVRRLCTARRAGVSPS